MAEAIDWPGLMRLGLGVLRLAPDAFWAMTPNELQRAAEGAGIGPVGDGAPMGRGRLAELMAAFPDGPGARREDGGPGAHPTGVDRRVGDNPPIADGGLAPTLRIEREGAR